MKFVLAYACIFMGHNETEFLKTQDIKPWFWKIFDEIFFTRTESEESLEKFCEDLNKFHPNLKVIYKKSEDIIKIKEDKIDHI